MSAPPFNYAVIDEDDEVVYRNGDLASARDEAQRRALSDPGRTFVVVQYVAHVKTETVARWGAPA